VLRDPEHVRQVVLNGRTVLDRDASRFLMGAAFSNIGIGASGTPA